MATKAILRRKRPFIGDEWTHTDDIIEVTDLADEGSFAHVCAAGPDHAEEALAAAHEAKPAMRRTTIPQRAEWCQNISEGLRDRKEDLAEVIVREAGKPISSARGEVESAAERFDRAAEEARTLTGEFREGTTGGHEGWEAMVKVEPRGTVLCISPYNYPLATTALQVAPALAAGNSIILKPSSKTPISAAILAEIITNLDLPRGAFNFVVGHVDVIGDKLAGDDRVNTIALTGSSRAGKQVARESGMVNLHMELGGNAPAIVFPDADLDAAMQACAKGSFKYAGQRCSAVSRVLVHQEIHDEAVDRLDSLMRSWTTGDLFDEDTKLGPLITEAQAKWVEELVQDALNKGATLVCGGDRDGNIFEPTLLADVPHDARLLHEEQFGPAAVITAFETEAEAVEIANASDLALDGAVFTTNYDRALRVADEIDAGGVRINGAPSHGLGDIPFGGNKASGIGREGIGVTIEEMVRRKTIVL
jgi:glyceraldehyde-3-phosphate dehydrogenase [NAD(P)+]